MIGLIASIQRRVNQSGPSPRCAVVPRAACLPVPSALADQQPVAPRHSSLSPLLYPHRAFTLVELLVTIVIIGILAGMSLAGLHAVQNSARIDRTKATINKINAYVMEQYENYRARRIRYRLYAEAALTTEVYPNNSSLTAIQRIQYTLPTNIADRVRLDALRETIRLEMPERWTDLTRYVHTYQYTATDGTNMQVWMQIEQPAVSRAYNARYSGGHPPGALYESAKCLHMLVMAHDPEAREHFNESEIGRVDNSDWPVFLDAWGNPIAFLRWAPAFNDSDIQRSVFVNSTGAYDTGYVNDAILNDHDPFDPTRLDGYCWRLLPLIYSAGPDGIYDIYTGDSSYTYTGSPYGKWNTGTFVYSEIGKPLNQANTSITAPSTSANSSLDHFDNIHNHRTEVK